jgi:hypothetical protein
MAEFGFYDIVEVLETTDATTLGVSGTRGVILGISEGENDTQFAVLIGDTTYMLCVSDLGQTGERVNPNAIYGGEAVIVPPEHYPKDQ